MKNRRNIIFVAIALLVILLSSLAVWHFRPFGGHIVGSERAERAHTNGKEHSGNRREEHEVLGEDDGHDEHNEHGEEKVVKLSEEEKSEFGIELATAGPGKLRVGVTLPGEVVANADRVAHVVPRVPGVVREVRKHLGNIVSAGEVMAEIQSRELADAKARYLAARERVTLAEARFLREEGLWKKKITAEQEYLDTKQAYAEALIKQSSAEQNLHTLGFSDEYLKGFSGHSDGSFTPYEIVAPIEGTVIEKHITLGEKLDSNTNAFVVADLSNVWVNLTVYQKDLVLIRAGQQAIIRAGQGGAQATGRIDYVSPIVDEATRTATARVVLENADGRWRPGMFVTGEVQVHNVDVSLLAPRSALQTIDGQTVVFVQTAEGFEPHPVRIGRENHTHVEIVSGLKPGQRYVMSNAFTLKAELGKGSFGGGHAH